jgi:hypothetical protein
MTGLLRQFPATTSFDFADWLAATTSGQPGKLALSGTYLGTASEPVILPLNAGRALLYGQDASGFPTVRIVTPTPSAGTAVTIISSSTTLIAYAQVPRTYKFLFLINNDIYMVDCGNSGTVVTVTSISSDAGDAAKAEAFVKDVTFIDIADDATCFVIVNEFSNAGTRSWVSALWTLNAAAPSCTYVTRDVDATGSAAALVGTGGFKSSTDKTFLMIGGNATDTTTLRACKVTYTTSTVANTLTNLTTTSVAGANAYDYGRYSSVLNQSSNVVRYQYNSTAQQRVITFSGTPTINTMVNTGGGSYRRGDGRLAGDSNPLAFCPLNIDATTTAACVSIGGGGVSIFNTNSLVTGLAATATFIAAALDASGNYVYAYGEEGTNSPILVVMKRASV